MGNRFVDGVRRVFLFIKGMFIFYLVWINIDSGEYSFIILR